VIIVIAPDSFKGSLSAAEVCAIIAEQLKEMIPSAQIISKPMADGGEGTVEAILSSLNGRYISRRVMGPLPDMQVDAGFGWLEKSRVAIVEMAKASGLPLLKKHQLSPLLTTTYGTGQLVEYALEMKPARLLLAVGGSATVDGGVGAAMALGWKFLDSAGNSIGLGGRCLKDIVQIVRPERLSICPVDVLCDVANPLLGPTGAVRVFAPQKGADSSGVELLENGMENLHRAVQKHLSIDINLPGAGAAGGLAAGAHAFMSAKLVSGIDRVMEMLEMSESLERCSCVITGEGRFDKQSLGGKVISGIAKVAGRFNKKIYVIAGKVELEKQEYRQYGIEKALSISEGFDTDYAIRNAKALLRKSVAGLVESELSAT
jgi:glycerate kinase